MNKVDLFFKSDVWKIIKQHNSKYLFAYKYLSKIIGHNNIFIYDTMNYDPNNLYENLDDDIKETIESINNMNDDRMFIGRGYLIRKIGSTVVIANPPTTTEILYANTFIPYDSSF